MAIGIMELWNNGKLGIKTENILILISDFPNAHRKRSHPSFPIIPTFSPRRKLYKV
jgi:hypothetical protein